MATPTDAGGLPDYVAAFGGSPLAPNETLYVAELGGEVVGTFQTTMIISINGRGGKKLTIEAVQTRSDMRGQGIGAAMIDSPSKRRGRRCPAGPADIEQGRADAHRFYERLGFGRATPASR